MSLCVCVCARHCSGVWFVMLLGFLEAYYSCVLFYRNRCYDDVVSLRHSQESCCCLCRLSVTIAVMGEPIPSC